MSVSMRLLSGLLALLVGLGALGCDDDSANQDVPSRVRLSPSHARESAVPTSELPGATTQDPEDARRLSEWMRSAEELRGLRFLRSVEVRPLVRSEVAATIRSEIEAVMPADQVEAYRDAYAAMGLLPPGHDLVATFASIYGEQMVGRYSRREEALYLLEGESQGGYSRETVAVHELVHALQHQHFGLAMAMSEELRHNDDLVSALAGVLEGDATFTMLGARDLDPTTERSLRAAESFRSDMLRELEVGLGPLAKAPLLIRLSVLYPYAFGVVMAAHRFEASGNAGLDELLDRAPLSTLELLYSSPGVRRRTAIDFIELPRTGWQGDLAARGCELGHHNVAGSLSLRALFEEFDAPDTAGLEASWRGDRFVHVRCGPENHLLWLSRWESEDSAQQFVRAYRAIAPELARRAGLAGTPKTLREGRSVVVRTPALADLAETWLREPSIRSYVNFRSWFSQGCFGEGGGCPAGVVAEDGSARTP